MITLGYIAVHEMFQLAAAAAQIGQLESFHCSLTNAPGSLGRLLGKFSHIPSLNPVGAELIPKHLIKEYPWPLILQRSLQKIGLHDRTFHLMNDWFDRWVASRLSKSNSKVFVAAETCAMHSFRKAKSLGMTTILDYHGIPTSFLQNALKTAHSDLNLTFLTKKKSDEKSVRNRIELELADHVLVCSEFHSNTLSSELNVKSKIHPIPLWINTSLWREKSITFNKKNKRLNIIFAGYSSIAKGIPYLLKATSKFRDQIELTLVGQLSPDILRYLQNYNGPLNHFDYMPQTKLMGHYHKNDLLILPSLGESFGFVAMEAMACGLPVIVTENCGVPVPKTEWRVPAQNADAIAQRIQHYFDSPSELISDGKIALTFAKQFTSQNYRDKAAAIFNKILKRENC